MPRAIGGQATLLKASCKTCEGITSDLERVFARQILQQVRDLDGPQMSSNHHGGVLPIIEPPARLKPPGNYPPPDYRLQMFAHGSTVDFLSGKRIDIPIMIDNKVLSRVLAKMAHGFAVLKYGYGGFEPFLPRIILGDVSDIWYFVGSSQLAITGNDQHVVQMTEGVFNGEHLIIVYIKLYNRVRHARIETPTYQVVAGRLAGS